MNRLVIGAAVVGLSAALFSSAAQAQGGSAGGSVGNRGKSVSGEADSAPAPSSARSRKRSVKKRSRDDDDGGSRRSAAIAGVWKWTGACERGAINYVGTMTFEQVGDAFTARHGETNKWDSGAVTNVKVSASHVSFSRQFGLFVDQVELKRSGARMSGVIPNTIHSGRCELNFSKNDR